MGGWIGSETLQTVGLYPSRNQSSAEQSLMESSLLALVILLVLLELHAISEELFSLLTIVMIAYIFIVPKLMERSFRKKAEEEPTELVGVMMPSYARYALDAKVVREAFEPSPVIPSSTMSLESFFRFWMTPEQTDYVARDLDGNLGGILSLKEGKRRRHRQMGLYVPGLSAGDPLPNCPP